MVHFFCQRGVSLLLAQVLVASMAMWALAARPIFEVGIIQRLGDCHATASPIQCPEALIRELVSIDLLVDHNTDATGNCGIDAFLRSWRAMDSKVKHEHRCLRTCLQS